MNIEQIGAYIREQRLAQNLPQETVSRRVGISRSTLSQLENGNLPEIGIRKVMEVLAQLGLELTVRQAHQRPTLRELAEEQSSYANPATTSRKRVRRQSPSTAKEQR